MIVEEIENNNNNSAIGESDVLEKGEHSVNSILDSDDFSFSSNQNKYDNKFQGPFEIFIQTISSTPIDLIAVGRIISPLYRNDIIEIKKSGYSRITVHFKTRRAANDIISNSVLK